MVRRRTAGLTGRRRLTELLLRAPARLSIGLAAVAAILLVFMGIAVFAMPSQCVPGLPGSWGCLSTEAPAPAPKLKLQVASTPSGVRTAPAAAAAGPAAGSAPKPVAPATAAPRELIDATFAQLPTPAPASVGTQPGTANPATGKPAAASAASTPATRVVATTVIHADPAPAPADAVSAYANTAPPITVTDGPAAASTALATAAPEPVPMAPPPPRAAATASSGNNVMRVGGSGVTVRSAPSRAGGPLFNLAAGEKVTVAGRQRGWVEITDAHGRHGWAYSSLLRKS